MIPARTNDSQTALPATSPADPSNEKIPAPTIDPTPMNAASRVLTYRRVPESPAIAAHPRRPAASPSPDPPSPAGCGSSALVAAGGGERVGRGDDVVGAADRPGHGRQRIRRTAVQAGPALENRAEDELVAREPDEDRPVPAQRPVCDVAAEDLAERVLVGPRDVRAGRPGVQLLAVGTAAADDRLLGDDR